MARKIKLTQVNFGTFPKGSTLPVGKKGISKTDADILLKWGNAEEIIEKKLPSGGE